MNQPQVVERVIIREPQSNGLGLAGFIVSLVGFLGGCFGGAILCPAGLVMSAIAMKRRPRGFAIAGLVIGIVGSLWLLIAMIALGGVGLLSMTALSQARDLARFAVVDSAIRDYKHDVGYLPVSLPNLESQYPNRITPAMTKGMGYRQDSLTGYTLSTAGKDDILGTPDDVTHSVTLETSTPSQPATYAGRKPDGIEVQVETPKGPQPPAPGDTNPK